MRINGKALRTIWFEDNKVKIIDQTKLPHQFIIKDLKTVKDAINAIKVMEVRGAPLIGGTAAYRIVLAIIEKNDLSFINKLNNAKRPLLISGRGARNSGIALENFLTKTGVFYLDTQDSRGLISSQHRSNVYAARSKVISEADLVILNTCHIRDKA